ncbi:MAG TPA: efflux RND transporter periplasmic adaptor subunit [Geomonas sp.]|nr:efflux RND transporter periplasmic adaptor subunit [Geomonas sp.]
MKKTVITIAVIAAVLLLAGILFPHRPPQQQFRTIAVERGELVSTVSATGTLAAVTTVQVGTNVSGTIQKLFVDYNSKVKAGQVIAQIDPALYNAKVKETRGNYQSAVSNVEKAKEELTDARRTLDRNKKLFRDGIISQADLDAADTKYKVAVAALNAAEHSVKQNQGIYDQAATNLGYATITSPIDGVVISRDVELGQTVAASFQTPTLFTIAKDLRNMEIRTSVDEADISAIRLGQPVTFTVDAYPKDVFKGKVSQIRKAPIMTQNVVTYIVVVSVDNPGEKLMPGTTANVTIETQRKNNVIKVPSSALLFSPDSEEENGSAQAKKDGERLYVLRDGRPVPIKVTTGMTGDSYVEIVSSEGLKENDQIIVETVTEKKKESPSSSGPPRGGGPF